MSYWLKHVAVDGPWYNRVTACGRQVYQGGCFVSRDHAARCMGGTQSIAVCNQCARKVFGVPFGTPRWEMARIGATDVDGDGRAVES